MRNNHPLTERKVFGLVLCLSLLFTKSLLSQSLSGYYTLGGEHSDFPTFQSAIHKLDSFGISGPVVFKVNDGVYYESDTIHSIKGASAINTILFQSESRDSSSVVIEWNSQKSGNWNLWLNRAGFITFKNIGFRQLFDSGKQNVHLIGCHNITFESCLFEGSNLVMDGALLTGCVDSNLTIKNCTFRYARRGIDLRGAKGPAKNILFTGNLIHTQNTGIVLSQTYQPVVHKNHFENITGGTYVGVLIKDGRSVKVSNNKLSINANADHSRAIDLSGLTGDSLQPTLVFNNVVNMSAQGGKDVFALKAGNLSNTTIANNNLVLKADNSELAVAGFFPEVDGITNSLFINNIVANFGSGAAYVINPDAGEGLKIDHNLWYAFSGNIKPEVMSLAAIINSDSSNKHSYFADPVFQHSDTLISHSPFIDSNAVFVLGISEDFIGTKRNSDFPDIGAFERLHLPCLVLPTDTSACKTLTISAKSNGSWYNWSNGEHSDSITVTTSGRYWVTVINGDGYTSDSTDVIIFQPDPFVIIATLDSLLPGQCVQLSTSITPLANSTVVWSDATGLIGNQNSITVCPQTFPAAYTAEVLDSNGCSSQQSVTIFQGAANNLFVYKKNEPASATASATKIQTKSSSVTKSANSLTNNQTGHEVKDLIVFPNPTADIVDIKFSYPLPDRPTIHISDIAGNLTPVYSTQTSASSTKVDLRGLPNGSYVLVIATTQNVFRKSVVKIGS